MRPVRHFSKLAEFQDGSRYVHQDPALFRTTSVGSTAYNRYLAPAMRKPKLFLTPYPYPFGYVLEEQSTLDTNTDDPLPRAENVPSYPGLLGATPGATLRAQPLSAARTLNHPTLVKPYAYLQANMAFPDWDLMTPPITKPFLIQTVS